MNNGNCEYWTSTWWVVLVRSYPVVTVCFLNHVSRGTWWVMALGVEHEGLWLHVFVYHVGCGTWWA